jgi:hypothetical protein
VGTIVTPLD